MLTAGALAAGMHVACGDMLNRMASYEYTKGKAATAFENDFRSDGQLPVSGRVHAVIDGNRLVLDNREYPGRYIMVVCGGTTVYHVNDTIRELRVWPAGIAEYGIGSGGGACWVNQVATDYDRAAELRAERSKRFGGRW